MPIEFRDRITRAMLRAELDKLFVFGDNFARHGMGGQAIEMRGEPNAIGLPTKHRPSSDRYAYFTDDDFPRLKLALVEPLSLLHNFLTAQGTVVWPKAGIGTGLAQLESHAPKIYQFYRALPHELVHKAELAWQDAIKKANPKKAEPK